MPIYPGRRPGTKRVTVWAHGRQHEWIVEGKHRDAVRLEAQKRIELAARPVAKDRASPTFSSFVADRYEPYARERLADSTWRRVRVYQVATLVSFFGAIRLDEITVEDFESYKSRRLSEKMEPSSVNNESRLLRTILRWADSLGVAVTKARPTKLKEAKPRTSAWSDAETSPLLSAMRREGLGPIVTFMLNTGVRKGEAIAAEWSWIDWSVGMLRIPVTEAWKPKDAEAREVPLDASLLTILRKAKLSSEETVLFPRMIGGGAYGHFPQNRFMRAVKAAGLRGSPHKTRHTFASHFLQRCPDIRLLATVLGQSHTRTTELYAHMLPDHLERARGVVSIGLSTKGPAKTLAADPGGARKQA